MSLGMGTGQNPPGCDEAQDLLGAYALDSLEPSVQAQVRTHLEGCPACRREAEELRVVAMQLGEAVAEQAPPPELRRRILAQVRSETAVGIGIAPVAESTLGRRLWWSDRSAPWVAVAAAAVLALAAGGWGLSEHFSTPATSSSVGLMSVGVSPVDRLIADGDSTVIRLTASSQSQAHGALVTDPGTGKTYLLLLSVPTLRSHQVYALWYMALENGSLTPVRIGQVAHAGAFRIDVSPGGYTKVAVTREPKAGDSSPRGPVLLAASLS